MYRCCIFFMVVWVLMALLSDVHAESTAGLVDKGNAAYQAGKYDAALSAYDEASVKDPESPYLYFNRGAAFYRKGDYAKAAEAFKKAALKSKGIRLEAESDFNLGNCAFREAERQQDSDLNKALEECGKSIRHYQDALGLDPDFHEAAENVEVVRLVMKNILDQINKQKEAQKQQQEAADKAREKLEELIKRQQEAINQNRQIEEQRAKGDTQEVLDKINNLTKEQKDIQTETEKLAEDMSKTRGKDNKKTPAEAHLDNAVKEEQAAAGNLEQKNTRAAMTNQEKALKELKDALSPPDDGKKSGQSQQQDKGQGAEKEKAEKQQGQKQKQEQNGQQQPASPGQEPQKKEEGKKEGIRQFSDDANDILEEEKENKQQRHLQAEGGYKDVDKDW